MPVGNSMKPENAPSDRTDDLVSQDGSRQPEQGTEGLETPEDLLAQKQREAQEHYDKWLRCQAEFENYKKRLARENETVCKFANEGLVKELLPTIDNLDRALEHSENDVSVEQLKEGIELTRSGLMSVLEKQGLKPVDALDEKFDPNLHEAVAQAEDGDKEEQTVIRVIQKGYMLKDRLIRPAMVVVSKRPQ